MMSDIIGMCRRKYCIWIRIFLRRQESIFLFSGSRKRDGREALRSVTGRTRWNVFCIISIIQLQHDIRSVSLKNMIMMKNWILSFFRGQTSAYSRNTRSIRRLSTKSWNSVSRIKRSIFWMKMRGFFWKRTRPAKRQQEIFSILTAAGKSIWWQELRKQVSAAVLGLWLLCSGENVRGLMVSWTLIRNFCWFVFHYIPAG